MGYGYSVAAPPTVGAAQPQRTPTRSGPAKPPQASFLGNQAALRRIQAKLIVGQSDSPLESEADRVADQVMRMPAPEVTAAVAPPRISRKCDACEEEEKLQKKEAGPQAAMGEAPASVHRVLQSSGQALDTESRAFMDRRFGRDFSRVQVHVDAEAVESARAIGARAFAVGHHIVFGQGEGSFASHAGRRLLAHELVHVVQQAGDLRHGNAAGSPASSLLQRSPLNMPSVSRLSGAALEARAREIVTEAGNAYLKASGDKMTLDRLRQYFVVAVGQGVKDGKIVTLVGINDKKYQPYVEQAVRQGERIVEPIELTALNKRTDLPNKTGAAHSHAEPTIDQQAKVEGLEDFLQGSSIPGCADCVEQIAKNSHVNPGVASRGSVSPSGGIQRPVTTTAVDIDPTRKFKRRPGRNLPPREISRPISTTGEIHVPQRGSVTPSGGAPRGVTRAEGEIHVPQRGSVTPSGGAPRGVTRAEGEIHVPQRGSVTPSGAPGGEISLLGGLLDLVEIAGTVLSILAAKSDYEQHDYVGASLNAGAAIGLVLPTVGEVAAPLATGYEGVKAVAELAAWQGECQVLVAKFETGTISEADFDDLVRSCPEMMIGREEVQRVFRAWANDEWPLQ